MNARGSHLPEAMRAKHVKASNFQRPYKKCTSIYGKVKNAKKDEYQQILTTAQRIKGNLKSRLSSQAQKCIIDNLFTGSGFADKDGLVSLLFSSLYWVKARRNTEYKRPVVCLNLCESAHDFGTYLMYFAYAF